MIYVYCRRGSDSARALANALGGFRIRSFDGMHFWRKNRRMKFAAGDTVISWGEPVPEIPGVMVLNGITVPNKFEVAKVLGRAGISTITCYNYDPRDGFDSVEENVKWMPRKNNHVGGNDLLNPPAVADFWVYKQLFTHEYRIHSFGGKSIRAGLKVLREGYTLSSAEVTANPELKLASSWIRSFDGGWRINYDEFKSKDAMRTVAHAAVATLGLTFGAVDVARTKDGQYLVLEVNRAPGLEGNSIEVYADAVKEWIANETGRIQGGIAADGKLVQPVGSPARVRTQFVTTAPPPAPVGEAVPQAVGGPGNPIQQEQPEPARANQPFVTPDWIRQYVANARDADLRRAQAVPNVGAAVQAVPNPLTRIQPRAARIGIIDRNDPNGVAAQPRERIMPRVPAGRANGQAAANRPNPFGAAAAAEWDLYFGRPAAVAPVAPNQNDNR